MLDETVRGGDGGEDEDEVGEGEEADSDMVDELELEEELNKGGEGVVLGDKVKLLLLLPDLEMGLLAFAANVTCDGGGALIESHKSSSCFKLSFALSFSI